MAKFSILHQTHFILEATKQVLAANCWDFTPNGVGEYAGKALYYEKQKQQVVF
jgi:hypothetical protein